MTFNEFQRELRSRGIDDKNAYIFSLVYEQTNELAKRIDDCASVLLNMANTIRGLTDLNEQTQKALKRVERGGRPDGIDVFSVRPDEYDK